MNYCKNTDEVSKIQLWYFPHNPDWNTGQIIFILILNQTISISIIPKYSNNNTKLYTS